MMRKLEELRQRKRRPIAAPSPRTCQALRPLGCTVHDNDTSGEGTHLLGGNADMVEL